MLTKESAGNAMALLHRATHHLTGEEILIFNGVMKGLSDIVNQAEPAQALAASEQPVVDTAQQA